MKVLFLTDGVFPFQIGGMQKYALTLAKQLLRNGIELHIVHCGGENYTTENFNNLFSEQERTKLTETHVKFPKTDPFPGHYIRESKMYAKNVFFEVEDQLNDFDLVYAQGFAGWWCIKEKHKQKLKIPILVNFHGLEMFQTAPNIRVMAEYTLFKNAVKWNLRNADYAYSFGGKIDQILLDLGLKDEEILEHSNGIGPDWLSQEPSKNNAVRKFVFVGRAERRKGIEELNKALKQLIVLDAKFEFTFIGPVKESLQIKDERLNYAGEIRDEQRIKKILHAHDCLVCPSHSEGMPTVILEAMACGLAIIGTNVGAVERQIKGNGILLEKPNVKALQGAIESVINATEAELKTWKKNSLNSVEKEFLWDRVVEQKLADFKHCLLDKKVRAEGL